MNRARKQFLSRNEDPTILDYINDPTKDIVVFNLISANHLFLLPYKRGMKWTEDKIAFNSLEDINFFLNWYNQTHKIKAELV